MTKTKLKWRLSNLPTPSEIRELVKETVITKDEAREILFSSETEEERDKESLKSEIKFLRNLVERLSNREKVVEIIREIEKPYWQRNPWWRPYDIWCSSNGTTLTDASGSLNLNAAGATGIDNMVQVNSNFSDIKTF